jgi:oxygen-independent coproporphyrinogen-3 oxidase
MKALEKQLRFELNKIKNTTLISIFFGGGTPSSIDSIYYESIFKILKPFIDETTEITSEANPNSASIQWLGNMKKLGVNRISFGIQSFNDNKLKFLGRNHNKIQAIDAIKNAKKLEFVHINCDIIYDTSLDNESLLYDDLDIIATLPIDHVSAYSLIIEKNTKFENKHQYRVENIALAKILFAKLETLGFKQYEISNFSKNIDAKSKHNCGYWHKEDYIGVGAGAVGSIKNIRYYPISNIQEYINNPYQYKKEEKLSNEDIKFETLFLGLRSEIGVSLNIFNKKELKQIKILEKENKILIKDNKIFNRDYLLSDEIVLFI